MKPKLIRYGKVVPHPVVKFSTIKVEIEAEIEEDEAVYDALTKLKKMVMSAISIEGRADA